MDNAKITKLAEQAAVAAHEWRQTLNEGTSWMNTDRLMNVVQEVAASEETARIYTTAALVLGAHGAEGLAEWVVENATMGSDDTWSGRGNDLRRVVADARREALRRLVR